MDKQHHKAAAWVLGTLTCTILWLWIIAIVCRLVNGPIL